MDEFNSLEDYTDMGEISADEKASIVSGASPMTVDKRKTIQDFIHTFEEKKRKKKRVKTANTNSDDDSVVQLSPLVQYMKESIYA